VRSLGSPDRTRATHWRRLMNRVTRQKTAKRLILIIDPQNAFCGEDGSLSKAFGCNELSVIKERLRDLELFLTGYSCREELCVVRSEYKPGQFTNGVLGHPYSQACVPSNAEDCGRRRADRPATRNQVKFLRR
jgi:hypothetical protein